MTQFDYNKHEMDQEMDRFIALLNNMLPRYSSLLRKNMSHDDVTELGELEHYLIELNSKIIQIKNRLQNDLFGETIDTYYQLKIKAQNGDEIAKSEVKKLRKVYLAALQAGNIICWN